MISYWHFFYWPWLVFNFLIPQILAIFFINLAIFLVFSKSLSFLGFSSLKRQGTSCSLIKSYCIVSSCNGIFKILTLGISAFLKKLAIFAIFWQLLPLFRFFQLQGSENLRYVFKISYWKYFVGHAFVFNFFKVTNFSNFFLILHF